MPGATTVATCVLEDTGAAGVMTKHATIRAPKTSAFTRLVSRCVRSPQTMPRHCSTAKNTITSDAVSHARPNTLGTRSRPYSPITIDTAAHEAQVEIQSLQPITNPAYGPKV